MIPESTPYFSAQRNTENAEIQPTRTYRIDFANGRIIGTIDGREAVVQFVQKVLSTDKYAFEIYDWYYGHELVKVVGQPYDYVTTRLPSIIKEALLIDARILDVHDFSFSRLSMDTMSISCTVETIYGPIDYTQEVSI